MEKKIKLFEDLKIAAEIGEPIVFSAATQALVLPCGGALSVTEALAAGEVAAFLREVAAHARAEGDVVWHASATEKLAGLSALTRGRCLAALGAGLVEW